METTLLQYLNLSPHHHAAFTMIVDRNWNVDSLILRYPDDDKKLLDFVRFCTNQIIWDKEGG